MFRPTIQIISAVLIAFASQILASPAAEDAAFVRASTPTKSKSTVHGVLTTPGGTDFNFVVRDGQWVRATDNDSGHTVAFLAALDESGTRVTFQKYSIVRHKAGESVSWIEDADFELGVGEAYAVLEEGYTLQVVGIKLSERTTDSDVGLTPFERRFGTKGECCVTCADGTVCGCEVSSSCGSCWSGNCSGSPTQDNPGT